MEAAAHHQCGRLLGHPHAGGQGAARQLPRGENDGVPARQPRGRIFISKAVILLCLAKKNRDADHLQNFVFDQQAGLNENTLAEELRSSEPYVQTPDYAYDCHTSAGKKRGKTKADFFKAEQAALEPFQLGLFDHPIDDSRSSIGSASDAMSCLFEALILKRTRIGIKRCYFEMQ
jgi:hypothetical protein